MYTRIIALLVLLLAAPSFAANWYVRPNGGTYGLESGTDWTNAFDGPAGIVWGSVAAGDNIFVAGGTYTVGFNIQAAGTAGSRITIKRATVAAHGTETGWDAGFDNTVTINPTSVGFYYGTLNIGSYTTIDGVTDNGFVVNYPNAGSCLRFDRGSTNVTMQYVKCYGPYTQTSATTGIDLTAWNGSNYDNVANLTIAHCDLSNSDTLVQMLGSDFVTFEYNAIHDAGCSDEVSFHPNSIYVGSGADNGTIRYNTFYNLRAEGVFFTDGGTSGWKLYGNVFRDCSGSGRAVEWHQDFNNFTNFDVYNNSFIDVDCSLGFAPRGTVTGNVYNNIFYNTPHSFSSMNHDYNASSGANTETNGIANMPSAAFVNYAGKNFHIVSTVGTTYPKDKGTAAAATYNTDMDGVTRGGDGTWDIGAYEYTTGADTTPDAFSFTDVTGAALSTVYTSNSIQVTGIDNTAAISVTGGTYSINGGAYTSDAGTVTVGDNVVVRATSSGSYSTAVNCVLSIGGTSDTYTVTTAAAPAVVDPQGWSRSITIGAGVSFR